MTDLNSAAGMFGGAEAPADDSPLDIYTFLAGENPESVNGGNYEPLFEKYRQAGGQLGLEEFEQIAANVFGG